MMEEEEMKFEIKRMSKGKAQKAEMDRARISPQPVQAKRRAAQTKVLAFKYMYEVPLPSMRHRALKKVMPAIRPCCPAEATAICGDDALRPVASAGITSWGSMS